MSRVSRSIVAISIPIICTLLFSFSRQQIVPRLQKKIDAAIRTTYGIEGFELKRMEVSKGLDEMTPSKLKGDHLFEIRRDDLRIGYVYLGEAPSMKRVFDFIVLFDSKFTIKKTKVLIYREDYGQQIGSQRWLKQFIGLVPEDTPIYGEDIDAIAGATISASNMTREIGHVLRSMAFLKKKK